LILEVKVSPNAKCFGLSFKDVWKASVASPPEKGKANAELVRELGRLLGCPVRIVRGASGRRKVLEVGLDEDEFGRRTKACVGRKEHPKDLRRLTEGSRNTKPRAGEFR
jgi:uncharacterized protein (TIGR00251 family)